MTCEPNTVVQALAFLGILLGLATPVLYRAYHESEKQVAELRADLRRMAEAHS